MKRGSITRFKLNPKKPPKSDWRAFDAMSEEARHRAAVSDPDALPATEAQEWFDRNRLRDVPVEAPARCYCC